MKKTLLLLAGYPGTGKTYFGNLVLEIYPNFKFVSQDVIKEQFFDTYGFSSMEEKKEVIEASRECFYKQIETFMKQGKSIISDYPFSHKQRPVLEKLSRKYKYQVITVRFTGDLHVIYKRQRIRDLDPTRHLGHIVSCYHKGDTLENRTLAGDLITFESFKCHGSKRGYDTFTLGHLMTVDTSDFSKVDYTNILKVIKELIQGEA